MTALLILGVVVVICLSATVILVTVTFRHALAESSLALERNEIRSQKHLDTVLDRLMTIKWEDYAVVRSTSEDEVGGFEVPGGDEEDDELVVDDGRWGHLSTLRERLRLTDNEAALINEDFDETGSPRR